MVGQITGKMFDQSIEKDCVSDLSGPASCRIGPVRQVAGPENAVIQNLAALQGQIINILSTDVDFRFQTISSSSHWNDCQWFDQEDKLIKIGRYRLRHHDQDDI